MICQKTGMSHCFQVCSKSSAPMCLRTCVDGARARWKWADGSGQFLFFFLLFNKIIIIFANCLRNNFECILEMLEYPRTHWAVL